MSSSSIPNATSQRIDSVAVSVVIPLYNKEKEIARAVKSVLAQTYADFELIVVDDGSTDNSYASVSSIRDDRMKIVPQSNQGECAARNRGIAESACDLVAFLDADDEWRPGFLERIIRLREKYIDCRAYATAFTYVTDVPAKRRNKQNPFPPGWEGIIEDYFPMLRQYTPFQPSSIAVDRELLCELGGFKNGLKLRGDIEMWVRMSAVTQIAYSNEPLALYHLDAENRVCEIYTDEDLALGAHLITLDSYLRRGKIPAKLRPGAIDYLSFSQLNYAMRNMHQGNRWYALKILLQWRFSKPYFKRWLRLVYHCLRG